MLTASVNWNKQQQTLEIRFRDWKEDSVGIIAIIGAASSTLSLILIIIATNWQYRNLIPIFFATEVIQFLTNIILRNVGFSSDDQTLALAIVFFTFTFINAAVLLEYLWLYMVVPAIVKWQWRNMITSNLENEHQGGDDDSEAIIASRTLTSFPYITISKMIMFMILCLPLLAFLLVYIALRLLASWLALRAFDIELNLSFSVFYRLHLEYWVMYYDVEKDLVFYKAATQFSDSKPSSCFFSYKGGKDQRGCPHGFGEWKDSDPSAEVVIGRWLHGIPIAPFSSREQDTGTIFKSIQVAYTTCSKSSSDDVQWKQEYLHTNATGVLSVECCVSGTFYREHPATSFLLGEPPKNVAISLVMNLMLTDRFQGEAKAEEGCSMDSNAVEVLLFIPGFNSCLSNSTSTFGQFLALGGFPENIVPWIFVWPMGAVPTFFQVKAIADSLYLAERLRDCLTDICSQRCVTRISIIGHSMGARVLLSYLKHFENDSTPIPLSNIILINGEADLDVLVSLYPRLAIRCERVTVYVDRNDQALFWAQFFGDLQVRFKDGNLNGKKYELGRVARTISDSSGHMLTHVDVIDASSVHGNVGEVKHCYFDLSREVIEDVRELVVSRKRAIERISRLIIHFKMLNSNTLDESESNLFGFLIAPYYYHH